MSKPIVCLFEQLRQFAEYFSLLQPVGAALPAGAPHVLPEARV